MEIILLESIVNLGELGDTVNVKAGYARNYLLPQHKAIRVTPQAITEVTRRREELAREQKERLDVAQARADLAVKSLTFSMNVIDEEGRLFGSVSTSEIIDQASAQGTELHRSEIEMPELPIKSTGEYLIPIKLHPEVGFDLKIVVQSTQEAKNEDQDTQATSTSVSESKEDSMSDVVDETSEEQTS